MIAVKKLTLGLRPGTKVFRVDSMWGMLIDALLDARGKEISDTYYTQIGETSNASLISMLNEKNGNSLLIDRQNIVFTKSAYPDSRVKLDEAFVEFKSIWSIIQKVVKFKGIRRIGIVAEHRLESTKNNNIELISKLTQVPTPDFPAHFSLHYESRFPAKATDSIDEAKGCFTNVIYDFYDSALDGSVPVEGKINVTLDYQKYYAPLLDERIAEEMATHFYAFKKELIIFEEKLSSLGLKQ